MGLINYRIKVKCCLAGTFGGLYSNSLLKATISSKSDWVALVLIQPSSKKL